MVAASANLADAVIVFDLVPLEEAGHIDDRFTQQLAFYQVKQDPQATDMPVVVKEGVNGFKRIVNKSRLNQRVIGLAAVDVLLKLRHSFFHVLCVGRNLVLFHKKTGKINCRYPPSCG